MAIGRAYNDFWFGTAGALAHFLAPIRSYHNYKGNDARSVLHFVYAYEEYQTKWVRGPNKADEALKVWPPIITLITAPY
jgi:hypothetical protein